MYSTSHSNGKELYIDFRLHLQKQGWACTRYLSFEVDACCMTGLPRKCSAVGEARHGTYRRHFESIRKAGVLSCKVVPFLVVYHNLLRIKKPWFSGSAGGRGYGSQSSVTIGSAFATHLRLTDCKHAGAFVNTTRRTL